jgi:catalase
MPSFRRHRLPIALALLLSGLSSSQLSLAEEKAPPPGGPRAPADSQVPRVAEGGYLTTNQGQRVNDDQNTLRAEPRGPALLEDFHFREKITHFDHERIPERVVHARGSGAHGYFQVYQSMAKYTKAKLLQDPNLKTPVFVRFSTVNGSRGSADTVRDARGFAVKFYTQDGVWDLVGKLKFDILDATKIWPEDAVPVQPVGKLVLNKNPDNFFAETEQSAFHTAHVVSGIDFSDDPLLQGRNFSYLDTQLNRFGTPNFTQLPINQPKSPVNNFQQDGFMRYDNRPGKANYEPNTLPGGNAKEASPEQGGYVTYPAPVQGNKVRERPKSFDDHYTQAALFYNSMSPPEQEHIADALKFELGKVTMKDVRQRMVDHLAQIDGALAANVAGYLGLAAPTGQPAARAGSAKGLSQEESPKGSVKTRHIAILAADGVDAAEVAQLQSALRAAGAKTDVVAPHLGEIKGAGGKAVAVDKSFDTADSVLYDAVYLPGGKDSVNALQNLLKASQFVQEAFAHKKAIGASGAGADYLKAAGVGAAPGVVVAASGAEAVQPFIAAVGQHRHWGRADR